MTDLDESAFGQKKIYDPRDYSRSDARISLLSMGIAILGLSLAFYAAGHTHLKAWPNDTFGRITQALFILGFVSSQYRSYVYLRKTYNMGYFEQRNRPFTPSFSVWLWGIFSKEEVSANAKLTDLNINLLLKLRYLFACVIIVAFLIGFATQ